MGTKRHEMVRWYSPSLLLRTGLRAINSTMVGRIVDNREIRAALFPERPLFEHHQEDGKPEDFWLDYVADLGDGWQSTHAVACAINADHQLVDGEKIPRGSVLIMGGDEVYPEPSIDAYNQRTVDPWNKACDKQGPFKTTLYALPGNHDWYDGLHAFSDIFCREESPLTYKEGAGFSHLNTPQSRSYFALRLKHGWWLCGIDIQLNDQIDSAQYDFFKSVAGKIKAGDRIILCAATPSWVFEKSDIPGGSKLMASVGELLCRHGGELRLVLCGDVHHYSRYQSKDEKLTLITAGGGGAFMHPTHALPKSAHIAWSKRDMEEFDFQECYPPRRKSEKLSYHNLWFLLKNLEFSAALGGVYMLLSWFLLTRQGDVSLPYGEMFVRIMKSHASIQDTLVQFFEAIPKSPEFALLVSAMTIALIVFNQSPRWRRSIGLVHAMLHFMGLAFVYCAGALIITNFPGDMLAGKLGFFVFFAAQFVLGAIIGGFVFGLVLIFSLNVLGVQWTNSFSALRVENYKNFLRMKIATDGSLTLFAFGIDDVSNGKARLVDKPIVIE